MKKLGEALDKAKLSNFAVAKVNCDVEKDVCSKFGIRGYPTLKWLPMGVSLDDTSKAEDYSKGRNVEDMVDFIKEKVPNSFALKIEKPVTFVKVLDAQNFEDVVFSGKKVHFFSPFFTNFQCIFENFFSTPNTRFLLNSTLHGVDIAREWLQTTKLLQNFSKDLRKLLLLNLMLTSTDQLEKNTKLKDSQP